MGHAVLHSTWTVGSTGKAHVQVLQNHSGQRAWRRLHVLLVDILDILLPRLVPFNLPADKTRVPVHVSTIPALTQGKVLAIQAGSGPMPPQSNKQASAMCDSIMNVFIPACLMVSEPPL